MHAMILEKPGQPLRQVELPIPEPGLGQVLVKVHACGVCRTDLHVFDGELEHPNLPLILGHQVVGTVTGSGPDVTGVEIGQRVGIAWLGKTCGGCLYCGSGRENLCNEAQFTGYQINGGYAEYTVADHRYCFRLPDGFGNIEAAPLLCAGLIGYRALRMAGRRSGPAQRLGLYGFGAAAHIITQVAIHQGWRVHAFTRPGDTRKQGFAVQLGAAWAGGSDELPPDPLDAAILFAPAGRLVPAALKAVGKGGIVVCAGIHMDEIPAFPYSLLWEERSVISVANLTRDDGHEFLKVAAQVPVKTEVERFPLHEANEALERLRNGTIHGAAVLTVDDHD